MYLCWVWDVGLLGCLYDFGNVLVYFNKKIGLEDYVGWLGVNFDLGIGWYDL